MKTLVALTLIFLTTGAVAQVGPVVGGDPIGTPGHCSDAPGSGDPPCTPVVTVSEPGSLWWAVIGAAALLLVRRRRDDKLSG